MPGASHDSPTEIEATLVLEAAGPDRIVSILSDGNELGAYALRETPDLDLRDRYFDTPARALGSAGLALRIREVGERVVLTLKGPPRFLDGGVKERLEEETEWSGGSLSTLLSRLRRFGIDIADPPEVAGGAPAGRALALAGLVPIHLRATLRRVRLASLAGGPAVAEIDIDTVRYSLPGLVAVHHEVEVEGRGKGAETHSRRIAAELKDRLGPDARPWEHGKLATGMALQTLADRGLIERCLEQDGRVRPGGYELMDALLGSRGTAGEG